MQRGRGCKIVLRWQRRLWVRWFHFTSLHLPNISILPLRVPSVAVVEDSSQSLPWCLGGVGVCEVRGFKRSG